MEVVLGALHQQEVAKLLVELVEMVAVVEQPKAPTELLVLVVPLKFVVAPVVAAAVGTVVAAAVQTTQLIAITMMMAVEVDPLTPTQLLLHR